MISRDHGAFDYDGICLSTFSLSSLSRMFRFLIVLFVLFHICWVVYFAMTSPFKALPHAPTILNDSMDCYGKLSHQSAGGQCNEASHMLSRLVAVSKIAPRQLTVRSNVPPYILSL